MSITEWSTALTVAERALDREHGEVEALVKRGKAAQSKAAEAKILEAACDEASKLLAQFADQRQAEVIASIEGICTAGLTSVFGEKIELKIDQVTRARRVEVDITVITDGLQTPILDARGGGLAAVTAFLLRITVLLLTRSARRLLVLDEPFAHLSADYAPRAADFLAELCEKTGTQVLMVTHEDAFTEPADRVIRITKKGDAAKVEVVK